MAARGMNTDTVANALGESWTEVRARLEAAGGASATHKELADALYPQYEGVVDNHGWWVQGAVVAYEQEIGRRVPGQRADGTFEVAVRRTVAGDREDVIARFAEVVGRRSINNVAFDGEPRRSMTPKRSYWRANLVGGYKVEAAAEASPKTTAGADATILAVTAAKLPDALALEEWRTAVQELVGRL